MASDAAARARLTALREMIARDAADLHGRIRVMKARIPQDWRELTVMGREVLEMVLWLRRRAPMRSTPPPPPPS